MQLYQVNHAVIRFWDTYRTEDAIPRRGDLEVCCADCLAKRGIPLSSPGVLRLQPKHLDGEVVTNACADCGEEDTNISRHLEKNFLRRIFEG